MTPKWGDLSKEEQCGLVGAAEGSTLLDLLALWRPGIDFNLVSPVADIPRMSEAVASLLSKDLVEVWVDGDKQSTEQARAAVTDERNWWTDEGPVKLVELGEKESGGLVLATTTDPFSFRHHDGPA